MALGNMSFSQRAVENSVEILFNSEYTGRALTLDSAAFTDGVCKAGTPIAANGTKANDATAIGVLLVDVHEERPQGTVVIGGYIHTARAQKHSGVTIAETAKSAMKNVVFC